MNWFNPFVWYAAFKGYVKAHFWAWNLSSVWSWVGAFGTSMAYPEWAQALASEVWPVMKDVTVVTREVVVEFLNTS